MKTEMPLKINYRDDNNLSIIIIINNKNNNNNDNNKKVKKRQELFIKYIKDEVFRSMKIFEINSNIKKVRTKNVNESCEKPQRCSLTTVRLVCSILTVVLFVTGPAHGNTAAARTRKEVHWTFMLPFLCGKESERSISLCNITHYICCENEGMCQCLLMCEEPNRDSFFHPRSLRSHWSHHSARRGHSRV